MSTPCQYGFGNNFHRVARNAFFLTQELSFRLLTFYQKSVVYPNTFSQFIQLFQSMAVWEEWLPSQTSESGERNFRSLCIFEDCCYIFANWKLKKIRGDSADLFWSLGIELGRTVRNTPRSDAFSGTTTSTYQYIDRKEFLGESAVLFRSFGIELGRTSQSKSKSAALFWWFEVELWVWFQMISIKPTILHEFFLFNILIGWCCGSTKGIASGCAWYCSSEFHFTWSH